MAVAAVFERLRFAARRDARACSCWAETIATPHLRYPDRRRNWPLKRRCAGGDRLERRCMAADVEQRGSATFLCRRVGGARVTLTVKPHALSIRFTEPLQAFPNPLI
jgi:hypothetical protein